MSALTDKMKSFANRISGTTVVNNSTDPNSAVSQMRRSIRSVPKQQAQDTYIKNINKAKVFGEPA